jgi:hypothetical protein
MGKCVFQDRAFGNAGEGSPRQVSVPGYNPGDSP